MTITLTDPANDTDWMRRGSCNDRPGNRDAGRALNVARNRAMSELVSLHRAEFDALYAKHRNEAAS